MQNEHPISNQQTRQLLFWGMLLFFLGLIQGVLVQAAMNPRMALSAHLAAVQSGMALMIFGLLWRYVQLGSSALKVALITGIASMYLIWIALTYGSLVGAGEATPIAANGFSASPSEESIFAAVITLGSVFGVVSGLLLVLGLARAAFGSDDG